MIDCYDVDAPKAAPCRKCGTRKNLDLVRGEYKGINVYAVQCRGCGSAGPYRIREIEAVIYWNKGCRTERS